MKFRRNLQSDVSNILADFPTKQVILSLNATDILWKVLGLVLSHSFKYSDCFVKDFQHSWAKAKRRHDRFLPHSAAGHIGGTQFPNLIQFRYGVYRPKNSEAVDQDVRCAAEVLHF